MTFDRDIQHGGSPWVSMMTPSLNHKKLLKLRLFCFSILKWP